MKKILILNGSPRVDGNSSYIASSIAGKLDKKNYEVTKINVAEKDISYCDGCLSCEETKECYIEDEMEDINEIMKELDYLVIVVPAYFDNVPAVFKNFIDRTNPIFEEMSDKKVISIVIGQADETSRNNTLKVLQNYYDILGLELIYSNSYQAKDKEDIQSFESLNNDIEEVIKTIDL